MTSSTLQLVVVGPGRLGQSVATLLGRRGHRVTVVGRGEPIPPSPLTWLTVPDRAIRETSERVPPGGVVLHASGATDLSALQTHRHAGSLHPLMSFPGPPARPPPDLEVPAAVAGDPVAAQAASSLADALGWRPFVVSGDRRLYHAAAVLAGNFATALLADAAEVLAAAGVRREDAPALLAPLALASLANAARQGPASALTGPVARGDQETVTAHQEALRAGGLPRRVQATYDALLQSARHLADEKG